MRSRRGDERRRREGEQGRRWEQEEVEKERGGKEKEKELKVNVRTKALLYAKGEGRWRCEISCGGEPERAQLIFCRFESAAQ